MKVVILTPVRLLGDGIANCLNGRRDISGVMVVDDLAAVRDSLAIEAAQVVLVDVTQGLDLYDVRSIAAEWPHATFIALGLTERRQDVVQCGRSGFVGYIARDASIDSLCQSITDITAGRQPCSPEISAGLLRALFRRESTGDESAVELALTRRECEVLALLGRGLSNKEIGDELCLSVPTVKHHVHHILEKLKLPRRAQAMRRVQDQPWLAARFATSRK